MFTQPAVVMVVTNMNYADLDFNLQMQSLLQPGGELEKDGGDDPGWLQNTKCKTENEKYKIQNAKEDFV